MKNSVATNFQGLSCLVDFTRPFSAGDFTSNSVDTKWCHSLIHLPLRAGGPSPSEKEPLLSANYSSSDKLYRNTGTKVELVSPKYCANNGLRLIESLRLGENWVQANGRPKDMACREILVTLYRKGLINLPPGKHDGRNLKRNRFIPVIEIDQTPLEGKLSALPSVKLSLVRNTPLEPLYNSLVAPRYKIS